MDKKEKKNKKSIIAQFINLGNRHYKDDEVEMLFDLVRNRAFYDGKSIKRERSYTSSCSDGKYTRDSETTYTIKGNDNGVHIREDYFYQDDDGQSGRSEHEYHEGKEILALFNKYFRNND